MSRPNMKRGDDMGVYSWQATPRAADGALQPCASTRPALAAIMACAVLALSTNASSAQRIDNQVAVFAALDKVTARISKLEIPLGETTKFGALKITPMRCYSRPPDVQPQTSTFVVVREIQLDKTEKKIFSGWMFAENPGLNAVEHPVYDVWLTECKQPKAVAAAKPSSPAAALGASGRPTAGAPQAPQTAPAPTAQDIGQDPVPRRRPPR